MFIDHYRLWCYALDKPVSVPSSVFVLFGNDEVLELRIILFVIIPDPNTEVLYPSFKVVAVLFFGRKREGAEILEIIAKRKLANPRPSARNRGAKAFAFLAPFPFPNSPSSSMKL